MGNLEVIEVIPLTAPSNGEKRQSTDALHRADESKQLEATRITQARQTDLGNKDIVR